MVQQVPTARAHPGIEGFGDSLLRAQRCGVMVGLWSTLFRILHSERLVFRVHGGGNEYSRQRFLTIAKLFIIELGRKRIQYRGSW